MTHANPLPRLAQKWHHAPLMILPSKAIQIAETFAPRVLAGLPAMGVLDEGLRTMRDPYDGEPVYTGPAKHGGVALIEIEGTLVDKGAWQGMHSGMTSYEALALEIDDAMADDTIKAVVFEVDSPGGMVSGAFELTDQIAALSARKPTMAILTDMACSAAYLLASACGTIIIPRAGTAGSIGVIAMHIDERELYKKQGLKPTLFYAGEKKADWHPLTEPRDGWVEEVQASINTTRDMFVEAVSANRPALTGDAIFAMQAGVYIGQDAVEAGLADAVADPKLAFHEFRALYGI